MKSSEIRWDLPCVLLSLAGALLWALLGGLLYHALLGKLWTPLLIGLYFFGMGLTAVLALKLHRRLRGAGRLKGRDRAVLAGILKEEDRNNPLSDETIAGMMQERGIAISRRTVAKYRGQMGIPGSSKRRRYS